MHLEKHSVVKLCFKFLFFLSAGLIWCWLILLNYMCFNYKKSMLINMKENILFGLKLN